MTKEGKRLIASRKGQKRLKFGGVKAFKEAAKELLTVPVAAKVAWSAKKPWRAVESAEYDGCLNASHRYIVYHRIARKWGFMKVAAQRSKEWFRIRMTPVTASRLATILCKLPYLEQGESPPAGVSRELWAKQKLFMEQTMQIPRTTMQETGDLKADHIRRGVYGEDIAVVLFEAATGWHVLEVGSFQDQLTGFMWVSADGLIAENGCNLEIKLPLYTKEFICGQPFTYRLWKCKGATHPHLPETCEGFHDPAKCAYKDVQRACSYELPCPECATRNMTIYVDQVHAQRHVLGCPGSYFCQLRAPEAIAEILGIENCIDKYTLEEYKDMVAEFAMRPRSDLDLPEGKTAADYLYIIHVERDEDWIKLVLPTLYEYHVRVTEYRERVGITFEAFCDFHGMKFEN